MFKFKLGKIEASVYLQLAFIGLLILINYSAGRWFHPIFSETDLSKTEKTVSLARNNGTYFQQIALYAQFIMAGEKKYKKQLKLTIDKTNTHLDRLENDNIPKGLNTQYFIPLKKLWNKYQKHANVIADEPLYIGEETMNPKIQQNFEELMDYRETMLLKNNEFVQAYLNHFDDQKSYRAWVLFGLVIFNMALIVLMVIYMSYYVVRPISQLNEIKTIISEGNFDRSIDYSQDDELGRVAISINTLFQNLQNATDFILDIGEGKLDTEYQRPEETDAKHDRLGTALLEMRDKMRQVNEADKQRNWVSEGLAKFADLFTSHKDSDDFTYIIISNLVKYVGANQGGLFIVEDEEDEDSHLELMAAYAYERRKYIEKKIYKGEGLIGEVYREGSIIYMTEVPNNYVHITSGMGEANPNCILLIPLKLNDEIYGVVELASFQEFEPYKIEFVEKLGESIASSFASVKSAQQTEKLLKESMQLGEQMKAQEEEMRQNLEELVATQEEVQRKSTLIEDQKKELEETLVTEQNKTTLLEEELKENKQKLLDLESTCQQLESENQLIQAQKSELEVTLGQNPKNNSDA